MNFWFYIFLVLLLPTFIATGIYNLPSLFLLFFSSLIIPLSSESDPISWQVLHTLGVGLCCCFFYISLVLLLPTFIATGSSNLLSLFLLLFSSLIISLSSECDPISWQVFVFSGFTFCWCCFCPPLLLQEVLIFPVSFGWSSLLLSFPSALSVIPFHDKLRLL